MDRQKRYALELLLDKFDNRAETLRRMTERSQQRAEHARRDFKNARENIIKPAMLEYGELLKSRGHMFRINELNLDDDEREPGLGIEFGIWFHDIRAGTLNEYPHIRFTHNGDTIRVCICDEGHTNGAESLLHMKGLKREHIELKIDELITRAVKKWL